MAKRNAPEIPAPQTVRFAERAEYRSSLDLTAKHRSAELPFALRGARPIRKRDADGGTIEVLRVEGHASVFNHPYDVYGGPARFGWIEEIAPGAFDETLAAEPDVVFLLNHQDMTMARTKSGTLKLEVDKVGLYQRADLDLRNPDSLKLATGIERGDIDEMSFAFWVKEQT